MASAAVHGQEVRARGIVAYSDAELIDYLDRNSNVVSVSDPENLPESFINRLRDISKAPPPSCPVDFNQVAARLLAIPDSARSNAESDDGSDGSRSRLSTTEPYSPGATLEKELYRKLVQAGGRPCYPIDMLDDVMRDPKAHRELLKPWMYHAEQKTPDWQVFDRQLKQWQGFREWQSRHRGVTDPAHYQNLAVEKLYKYFKRRRTPDFSGYTEAVKILLHKQGFQHPFELREDAEQQDRLSTWMEYLAFAYCFYEQSAAVVTHSSFQRFNERCDARQDYAAANAALSQLKEAEPESPDLRGLPLVSQDQHLAHLKAAEAQVRKTKATMDAIMERSQHFATFQQTVSTYEHHRTEMGRRFRQLQWTMEQVPLVEAERNQSASPSHDPTYQHSPKRKSSLRSSDLDEYAAEPQASGVRKQRLQSQEPAEQPGDQLDDVHPTNSASGQRATRGPLQSVVGSKAEKKQPLLKTSSRRGTRLSVPVPMATKLDPVGGRRSRRLAGKPPECTPLM
ncbi:hypothetical protein PGQ11_008069 [Apiospora arundinis]|uniref:Uncharacterized protein n=1 Tax=Apiospora arundinis TaxID=335852 RepID=A0ABR2IE16_9PEZI